MSRTEESPPPWPGGTLHVCTPQHSRRTGHPPREESTAPQPPLLPPKQDAGLGRRRAAASGLATMGPGHGECEEAALWWPPIPWGAPNQTKPPPL